MSTFPKTALIIMDGFGQNPTTMGNAILSAKTPNLDYLWSNYAHTLLKASEEEVGLSFGQIGNSEVGHMAIGTARVVQSASQRVDEAIKNGSFNKNEVFLNACAFAKKNKSKLQLIGMISSAGVHADVNHMIALLSLARAQGVRSVFLHPVFDGRDTGPKEAQIYLNMLSGAITKLGIGKIASVSGRAYAMDRNSNWDKTRLYYEVLVGTSNSKAQSPEDVLKSAYAKGLDDETVLPTIIDPSGSIGNLDAVIITNFRGDRARQIAHALADANFTSFVRTPFPQGLFVTTMTSYEEGLGAYVAFPSIKIPNTLSDVLEKYGLTQLHIAETEKYAHVTYFFKGGQETKLPHEDYVHIPSDGPEMFLEHPEMKAFQITDQVTRDMDKNLYDFYVINFANADMIGHTGNFEKAIVAIQAMDACIGTIAQKILDADGILVVTADHGNAEQLKDIKTGGASKDHTVNPVPFILVTKRFYKEAPPLRVTVGANMTGILQDIAPTILTLLRIPVPPEMAGASLFT